jgi:hypothetical protein
VKRGGCGDQQGTGPLLHQRRECAVEIALIADAHDNKLPAHRLRRCLHALFRKILPCPRHQVVRPSLLVYFDRHEAHDDSM